VANNISTFRLRENFDYKLRCERCGVQKKPHLSPMVSCACSSCWSPGEAPEYLQTWLQTDYIRWKQYGPMGRDRYIIDLALHIRAAVLQEDFTLAVFNHAIERAKPWPDEILWFEFRDSLKGTVEDAVLRQAYDAIAL